jgi:hypothetical protein
VSDLRAALVEVMEWISNWGPSFVHDDEWSETRARVDAALGATQAASGLDEQSGAAGGGGAGGASEGVYVVALIAAVQSHHDTKYNRFGGPGNRRVVNPVDLALYDAVGIAHDKLGFADGGCLRTLRDLRLADAVRALVAGRRLLLEVGQHGQA